MARVQIIATVKGSSGDVTIKSPRYNSRDDAEADLMKIREGITRHASQVTNLPWLAVAEHLIIAAWIEEVQPSARAR